MTRGELDIIDQPRLTIGLPVYNGEQYLHRSLDAVLGQTFEDFELIISSNASTDATDDICRGYEAQDSRIRFVRQPENIGAAPNHNFVFRQSRGELFKWASGDDLWARDLVSRCIAILDERPDVILAHSWTAAIDENDDLIQAVEYPLATASPRAPERLRSMLFDGDVPGAIRADDFYGVIRSDVLRKVKPHGSFHHADYTFMAELALHGPFLQVPEWLYFRRHHAGRASEAATISTVCSNLDPRRASRLRHPTARLVTEYMWSYFAAVRRAPLTPSERRECYGHLARWIGSRVSRRLSRRSGAEEPATLAEIDQSAVSVRSVVAGQEREA